MDKPSLPFLKPKNLMTITKLIAVVVVIFLGILLIIQKERSGQSLLKNKNQPLKDATTIVDASSTDSITSPASSTPTFRLPIKGALERVTKKPFGLYVSPKNSPIKPEHFSGYHTGVDFETTSQEQNIDVPIYTICSGSLVLKKIATGYGGVAVQSCQISNEPVTIIYGHLRLTSITTKPGAFLKEGEQIGFLGQGYSAETAGERKHLHLGIHKGSEVTLLGYVSIKDRLSEWINFLTLIK